MEEARTIHRIDRVVSTVAELAGIAFATPRSDEDRSEKDSENDGEPRARASDRESAPKRVGSSEATKERDSIRSESLGGMDWEQGDSGVSQRNIHDDSKEEGTV